MFMDVHPGRVLKDEMEARGLSGETLALKVRLAPQRIEGLIAGEQPITPDIALRLARHFGTTAQFWMDLQSAYDLSVAEAEHGARIAAEVETA